MDGWIEDFAISFLPICSSTVQEEFSRIQVHDGGCRGGKRREVCRHRRFSLLLSTSQLDHVLVMRPPINGCKSIAAIDAKQRPTSVHSHSAFQPIQMDLYLEMY